MISWRKAEQKDTVIKEFAAILFPKNEKVVTGKMARKIKSNYDELDSPVEVGMQVKSKKNHQVGEVIEIRGKRAVVRIGSLPMQVELSDLVAVRPKDQDAD